MSSIKPKKSNDTQTDDNPIQPGYDAKFDRAKSLKNAEEKGNDESSPAKKDTTDDTSGIDNVRNAEETPSGSWRTNVTGFGGMGNNSYNSTSIGGMGKNSSSTSSGGMGKNSSSTGIGGMGKNSSSTGTGGMGNSDSDNTGPSGKKPKFSFLKKKGPFIGIGITIVGGGIGIMALTSPSLLIVQFKEVMVNKFNTQLSSMEIRNTKMLINKMGMTKGLCGSKISLICKYSTMSKKQVANFEKAGITIIADEKTSLFGRTKPNKMKFRGQIIEPNKVRTMIKINPEFRSALKVAYNPKFAGFSDYIWKKVEFRLGISKKEVDLDGKTDKERLKKVQEATKHPADTSLSTPDEWGDEKLKEGYTQDEIDAHNSAVRKASATANELAEAADVASTGVKAAPKALVSALASIANAVKVTGWLDNACLAYRTLQSVGYAAKTVRALQLARYAMLFLNVADQIKAGEAKAEDVSYLGKILTTEVAASAASVKLGTATNSFGYRYAAYGERGTMSSVASQFMAGGGLTGQLIKVVSMINSTLFGNPKKVCGFLGNPIVGVASLIVGVGLMLIPGVNVAVGAWNIAKAAIGVALNIAAAYAPALLKDIIAGVLVDETTVGEAAGEAITSGSSGIMSNAAQAGGNAPLTPEQAVAYNKLTNEIASQYAEEDRLTHGPLDISNVNTFMGNIVSQLIPYASNMPSLSNTLGSIASLSTGSLKKISSQNVKASSIEDYTMCQDFDYNDIKGDGSNVKVAADPYCNIIYGIPPDMLEGDPIDVANSLIASGEINPDTGDPIDGSNYAKFVDDCIDRNRPMGDTGADGNLSDGSKCLLDDKNTENLNYYVHYIDQRVQAGQDDEEFTATDSTTDQTSGGDTNPVSGTTIPANVNVINGNRWVLKDNVDYSNVTCASGTDDNGKYTHPIRKFTIRKCATAVGEVASIISQKTIDMVKAAKQDSVTLTGSSFRSYEEQQELRRQHCPDPINSPSGACTPPTAKAGDSNHEKGIAIDFNMTGGVWEWLSSNAVKYGYYNLPSENWHWSTSGG